ncbi:MAG: hypothetical protein IKU46_08625 [Peptococcaceae bacterium]|nr:hypothetical protein [Peptococcaceae bacterium]
MTWVSKLKNFLSQNLFARLFLYAAALVEPFTSIMLFSIIDFPINPYNVVWIGFYSCLLLLWACNRKVSERIINFFLVISNGLLTGLWCLGALMGGVAGPLYVLLLMICPFTDSVLRMAGITLDFTKTLILFFVMVAILVCIIGGILRWDKKCIEQMEGENV